MTLEILICTLDEGINRMVQMLLPATDGIKYLVSWQQTGKVAPMVPAELRRPDVRVFSIEGKGLSRNRNNALKHAKGDVCLIADDDLTLLPEGLNVIITAFEQHPKLDIATFRYESKNHPKKYPRNSFDLRTFPKGYYVNSIEIAFRRESVQGKLWFDEHFGLGAPVLSAGEESVWMHDALAMGLRGQFYPVTIVRHDHATTSERNAFEKSVVMANAAYLYVAMRHNNMLLRALLMAWRVSRKGNVTFTEALRWVKEGISYAKSIRK
ncbi:MAG: glycosyltransferase family 2 protein [Muribaculaceae bacterium]